MSDNRWPRIQMIQLEVDRLNVEATGCRDLDRMTAIREELEVLYASAVEIRREQLMEQIDPPEKPHKRRWWHRKPHPEGTGR